MRLGVSYFPLYPLQVILHLYRYKQSYMSTVDFKRRNLLKRKNLESWNLCARLPFYCSVVYRSFQFSNTPLALFSLNLMWDAKFFSSYLKKTVGERCLWWDTSVSGHYCLIVALEHVLARSCHVISFDQCHQRKIYWWTIMADSMQVAQLIRLQHLQFSCSLQFADFSFFSVWFLVFVINTSVFSVLVCDMVFGF